MREPLASVDDEFDFLREQIAAWPSEFHDRTFSLDLHARLASCLHDVGRASGSGPADLAVLVAAVLNRQAQVTVGADLLVPATTPWSDAASWSAFGVNAKEIGAGRLRLTPSEWRPSWLEGSGLESPTAGLFDAERHSRRTSTGVPGDPAFIDALGPGFERYVSPGQRQAVRTVLAARAGATVVVSLPTGGGKTEVVLAEALRRPHASTSLVVVPTIGLALDQERRLKSLLRTWGDVEGSERPYAYVGDASSDDRAEMRRRVRSGEQRVIFASPESAVGSLAAALFDAASNGALRLLAIDEAHLVAAWGGDFRPEFQLVAGLRTALLRASTAAGYSPFKTVLLSATIPQTTLELLERLFGAPGPFETVVATALRAEPSYWSALCATEEERTSRFLEAIAHLPRPIVAYVATRDEAARWAQVLAGAGYRSYRTFTGDSSGTQRREVLASFRGPWAGRRRSDVVVATTAFGVGVDQSNIRAVLHLCVPESLDRFYQEVGRGGRDGHPSLSLLLWESADLAIAESLALERLITPEKGLERWQALQATAVDLGDGRRRLQLNSRPQHLRYSSRANRLWNTRTLALMAQSGLIALDAERPGTARESQPDASDDPGDKRAVESAVVRLQRGDVASADTWTTEVLPIRADLMRAKLDGLASMRRALRPRVRMCEALQAAYTVRIVTGQRIVPAASCGGCPGCRPRPPFVAVAPEPPPLSEATGSVSPDLERLFAGTNRLVLTWHPGVDMRSKEGRQRLTLLARACLRHGIELIVTNDAILEWLDLVKSLQYTRRGILFSQSEVRRLGLLPNLPTLIIDTGDFGDLLLTVLSDTNRTARRILVIAEGRIDPGDSKRTISDHYHPQYSVTAFLEAV
jgi:ATP-dependent DNA helicase RecQ